RLHRIPRLADRDSAHAVRTPFHYDQPDGTVRGARLLQTEPPARFRRLGQLSRVSRAGRSREDGDGARPDAVVEASQVLGHGTTGRPDRVGGGCGPVTPTRAVAPVDLAGGGARGRGGRLLPLADGDAGGGAVLAWDPRP